MDNSSRPLLLAAPPWGRTRAWDYPDGTGVGLSVGQRGTPITNATYVRYRLHKVIYTVLDGLDM
jgi:hypothetical protein